MNKTQRNLLSACWNKKIDANYEEVSRYAYEFKKYNNMTIREINEVVEKLKTLK